MPGSPDSMTVRPASGARDAVARMTAQLRAEGLFHCDTRLGTGEILALPPMPGTVMVHIVLDGACEVRVGDERAAVGAGAVALIPHGLGHSMGTQTPGGTGTVTPLEAAGRRALGGVVERLDLGSAPWAVHAVCAALTLEHSAAPSLPRALAPLVVVSPDDAEAERTRALAGLVLTEASGAAPGWQEVTSRLVDVIALRAMRRAVEACTPEAGWWSAAREPRIAQAIGAVEERPGAPWTLATLAAEAGMSRSAFARLFTATTGEAPMTWVARHRMARARALLAEGRSAAAVARACGYDSEVSFRRAYRRITGATPGATRRASARSSGAPAPRP